MARSLWLASTLSFPTLSDPYQTLFLLIFVRPMEVLPHTPPSFVLFFFFLLPQNPETFPSPKMSLFSLSLPPSNKCVPLYTLTQSWEVIGSSLTYILSNFLSDFLLFLHSFLLPNHCPSLDPEDPPSLCC